MRIQIRLISAFLVFLAGFLLPPVDADAVLKDFGPPNLGGFPSWYRDTTGLPLQQCFSLAASPAGAGGMCGITMTANPAQNPPFDPALPLNLPFNWPGEAFYSMASADPSFAVAGSTTTLVEFALESTFGLGDPSPGDQVVFARVRIRLDGMPVSGTYLITHPYGIDSLNIDINDPKSGRLTRDIGATGAPFVGALDGNIGPFLKWTFDPLYAGTGTNPDGTITVGDVTFIGDPNVVHTVTGSPFDFNRVLIEGPIGADLDGAGNNFVETDLFVIEGQVYTTPIPTPLAVNRSTYARNAAVGQVDVFANADPLSNQGSASILEATGTGIATTVLVTVPDSTSFVGYLSSPTILADPATIPATVSVTNVADQAPLAPVASPVVDEVKISEATFVPGTGILRVKAVSSDGTSAPALTAVGYGELVNGALSVTDLTIPPKAIKVDSTAGGSATVPVAVRDNYLVAAEAGANGSIAPSGLVALAPGSSPVFTITPNPGFRVADVLVDGETRGPVSVVTFDDLSFNHTIVVSFAP